MGNSNTTGKQIPKENDVNFGFGFNNIDFSDRVVRLEIDLASNENHLDDTERDTGLRVETLHINSLLLAAKSPFFYKLFNNGMRESHNKADEVTLRINASEEAAVMDVLNCVYDKPLKATSAPELLDVLMAADKFEVVSCMRHCIELLLKLPMSLESALSHLELSSSIFVGEVFEPLLDAAKQRIAGHYSDFSESQQKEAMALPLSALEAVLGSDGLKVDSEDDVFDFILNWVRVNYPKLEERREILTKHLTRYICFQYMSGLKLKEVVEYPDFDYEQVSKLVINALISKNQPLLTTKRGSPRRVYNYHLIKVVSFECAQPRCVVYFNLKKEACADLYPTKRLYSPKFCVGGRYFSLFAQCYKAEQDSVYRFGLFVNMKKGSADCALNFAFAVMKKPAMEFQIQANHNYTLTATDKARGQWLFDWTDLMSDESVYFMDGILHLQARITIKN